MSKVILSFICFILLSNQVLANELLVISGKNSKNSKKWQEEVYQDSIPSRVRRMSVKIVTIDADRFPKWITQAMKEERMGEILGTPTFIIWDEVSKKELGRLEGYTEKSRFYSQLDQAILQISQGHRPGRREGSGGHQEEGSGGNQRQEEGSGGMSQDVMDHIYKTPEEAKHFSELLGFGGEIHSHKTPEGTIYMPGPTM